MKNNKGYYSWIHSMKNAAMQSHFKGKEILNEEKARKITDPSKIQKLQAGMQPPAPTTKPMTRAMSREGQYGQNVLPIYGDSGQEIDRYTEDQLTAMMADEIRAKESGGVRGYEKPSVHSISLAGGDPGEYAQIRRQKHAEQLANQAEVQRAAFTPGKAPLAPTGIDMDDDGDADADDVSEFAQDVEVNRETIPGGKLPTYGLAAQARSEHARATYKEQSRAERMAARHGAMETEHQAGEEARQEGIEGIIDRMMRGKR